MDELDNLLSTLSAFRQARTVRKIRHLVYGMLTCLGRHTVTGSLTAAGHQFMDWSAAYRLFSLGRIGVEHLFSAARKRMHQELGKHQLDIVAHMDDTILKKKGKKIPGTAWRRDPLGPPFHTNFIWGQRFLQISMALPEHRGAACARAIPIDFFHCPTVQRPGKNADTQCWKEYRAQKRLVNLSQQGKQRIIKLRQDLNQEGMADKELYLSVDGSYTNKNVLKELPPKVTLIGRIRKDSKLYTIPEQQPQTGRKKAYGSPLPTPEQIRQSDQYPWQQVTAWAVGKTHVFDVKIVQQIRSRTAGQQRNLQLMVIRPLAYRLTKESRILYRQPAYLICTDSTLPADKMLQYYLWRWEIEVNLRDEKTILGCGEAQVRNPQSAETTPSFIVAIYSLLLLASHRYMKNDSTLPMPRPKWYPQKKSPRLSANDMINILRTQLWGKALGMSFSDFVKQQRQIQRHKNVAEPLTSALFYSRN